MERFRNFASLFAALNLQHLDFSLQPCMPTIASAAVEADTCRKYVVPICLGGVGSLFCGLKTFLPRRSQTKAGAFPARHSLSVGGSLPLSRRSETKTDCRAGLSRRNQTCLGEAQRRRMQAEAGRRRACRGEVKRRRKPFLSRRSVTKTEALVSVLGKFGGADQLPSPI